MKVRKTISFNNGSVHCIELDDGMLIETTDTFLPYYTKNICCRKNNQLIDNNKGSRKDRWMIGVSVMSGCPVRCRFCATGDMGKSRPLSDDEIVEQVYFVLSNNKEQFNCAKEHKINYTRMGEPFLNISSVKNSIDRIERLYPNTHHYISTIGIKESDFSFIKENITLQISLHSLDEKRRNNLIPFKNKMSIKELGKIRTRSNLKTTINLTLVDKCDFNISALKDNFDPAYFFIKLSPINKNKFSYKNFIGNGVVKQQGDENGKN